MGIRPLLFLIPFLLFSLVAFADQKCKPIKKNIPEKKYEFKCDNDILAIDCSEKDGQACEILIKSKIRSANFKITQDEIRSFNLFSIPEESKADCDISEKKCEVENSVCGKYVGWTTRVEKTIENQFNSEKRCLSESISGISTIADFGIEFIQDIEFEKEKCSSRDEAKFSAVKNRFNFYTNTLDLDISNPNNFFNQCIQSFSDLTAEDIYRKHIDDFSKVKNKIKDQMKNFDFLEKLICSNENFFADNKLDFNKLMCVTVESAVVEYTSKDYGIKCKADGVGVTKSRFQNENDKTLADAAYAKTDTTPVSQKPLPEIVSSEAAKPLGLTPALAKVEQIYKGVPEGSGPAEAASAERSIASGGVREIVPTSFDLAAGNAITPVYRKLASIADSAKSLTSDAGIIGGRSPSGIRGVASGVTKLTQQVVSVPVGKSAGGAIEVEPAIDNLSAQNTALGSKVDLTRPLLKSNVIKGNGQVSAADPIGSPRGVSLGSSSSGGGPARNQNQPQGVVDNSFASGVVLSTQVQEKLKSLGNREEIKTFFSGEALRIPNIRTLLYQDPLIIEALRTKKIKIVDQRGNATGLTKGTPDLVFSDNGKIFIPTSQKAIRK